MIELLDMINENGEAIAILHFPDAVLKKAVLKPGVTLQPGQVPKADQWELKSFPYPHTEKLSINQLEQKLMQCLEEEQKRHV